MKTIYYLALLYIVHTCIVNGVGAPRGGVPVGRRKNTGGNATPAPSNSTSDSVQNTNLTTITTEKEGSSSTNKTNTSEPGSTLKVPEPSKTGSFTGISSKNAVIVPITQTQVLSSTAGSGAETASVMQSVNYYLQVGIAIYFLMLQF